MNTYARQHPEDDDEDREFLEDVLEHLPEDCLALLVIRPAPEDPTTIRTHFWAHGIDKRVAAAMLRQMADTWDQDVRTHQAGLN